MSAPTLRQALQAAVAQLAAAGIEGATGDARRLLAFALGQPAERLILMMDDPLGAEAALRFAHAIARRMKHEPVSRIAGNRAFWGRDFIVTPDVLDPRADTETLIAAALEMPAPARLLDLGTGSGIIAITLLAEWPAARGIATDISLSALAVAQQNARNLRVADRLETRQSDWFESVEGRFDLIVSNPPYIAADEMPALAPDVHDYDPHIALTPGGDGLQPYRVLATHAAAHLTPAGRIMVEIGWTQGAAVSKIFTEAGLKGIEIRRDLEGRDRVVIARLAE